MKMHTIIYTLAISALTLLISCSSEKSEPSIESIGVELITSQGDQELRVDNDRCSITLHLTTEQSISRDIVAQLTIKSEPAASYPILDGIKYGIVPEQAVTLSKESITISSGSLESDTVEITIDPQALEYNLHHLLTIVAQIEGLEPLYATIEIIRPNLKSPRQILFFEVNNCNPLNALEYKMEDGSQLFDAVVLFAANINYDSENDKVYLSNNPNVQALLDQSDVYLQPLRQRGIKVLLGLLGNHDAAGVAQLSSWGAEMWAKDVALACKEYKLDGVVLDDEYSKSPDTNNKWFTSHSAKAGARVAYELKRAMQLECYWPTYVGIYEYGALYNLPEVVAYGKRHPQSEYIDILIPDYGYTSQPYGDLSIDCCTAISLEMNRGDKLRSDYTTAIKEQGYGWCMWFGFDPSGSGGVKSNLEYAMEQFEVAAEGFYGKKMAQPENVYHKIGEGKYDPTPHPLK